MTAAAAGQTSTRAAADPAGASAGRVSFQTEPERYRHWKLSIDGPVATLSMDVDADGGLRDGYELKMNSYDLGVDIELYDAVQRLRFEHPEVRTVVLTSMKEKIFCAGANIRMLAVSPHPWKVNFCKFTNETRLGMEDASAHSGQTYLAALNGTASGGGYELALACDHIMLIDDRSSAVSLPELPLLGVLPGTGGLTRVVDKRHVRRDRADYFATRAEGLGGDKAAAWNLIDEAVPRAKWAETVAERAAELAARSQRPAGAQGIALTPLDKQRDEDRIAYPFVTAELDRAEGTATITIAGPGEGPPAGAAGLAGSGASFWTLRTTGDAALLLAYDRLLLDNRGDWLANEIVHFLKRTLKRLDVTSRSLIALIEPGSCFAGSLLEIALAADRSYMLSGVFEEDAAAAPATVTVGEMNLGPLPMGNGLTRLQARFTGDDAALDQVREVAGQPLEADAAEQLGLVTFAPDDIDWADEIRIAVEERSSFSPDALTGLEANYRFAGPETMETKIFGRLTAWQNWIFNRPNASGPDGALRMFGTGRRAQFDRRRV